MDDSHRSSSTGRHAAVHVKTNSCQSNPTNTYRNPPPTLGRGPAQVGKREARWASTRNRQRNERKAECDLSLPSKRGTTPTPYRSPADRLPSALPTPRRRPPARPPAIKGRASASACAPPPCALSSSTRFGRHRLDARRSSSPLLSGPPTHAGINTAAAPIVVAPSGTSSCPLHSFAAVPRT